MKYIKQEVPQTEETQQNHYSRRWSVLQFLMINVQTLETLY
jgi:hypothetical protein